MAPESAEAHGHRPQKPACPAGANRQKGSGAPAGKGQGCGGEEEGSDLCLLMFFHLLLMAKPNLKPEGKGVKVMQPKKVWEDRGTTWKDESVGTLPLANREPGLLTGPGRSMERKLRQASELPLLPHCHLPGMEKPRLWQEVGSAANSSHTKLLSPKGSPVANT